MFGFLGFRCCGNGRSVGRGNGGVVIMWERRIRRGGVVVVSFVRWWRFGRRSKVVISFVGMGWWWF